MRSREAWTEPKKDGEMVPQVSPIELSPNREALEPHNPSREHDNVERIPEVTPHRVQPHGERVGSSYPIGPIMKVKYFRLNIVFESSVTVLWALVYVPDGLPIGKINVAGTLGDSVPGALYEPQQFIIASGVYTSQGSSGASAPLASLDAPSQESQSGRRGVPRLAGPNVGLLNPDYHHPQLLELCELNQKRWESLTIPKPSPLGGLGAKERSEATRGPPPRRCRVPKGPTQKGNTAQQYYPQLRPFDLRPPQKKPPKKLGYSITPNFGGRVTSGFEVQTSMRSREA